MMILALQTGSEEVVILALQTGKLTELDLKNSHSSQSSIFDFILIQAFSAEVFIDSRVYY